MSLAAIGLVYLRSRRAAVPQISVSNRQKELLERLMAGELAGRELVELVVYLREVFNNPASRDEDRLAISVILRSIAATYSTVELREPADDHPARRSPTKPD